MRSLFRYKIDGQGLAAYRTPGEVRHTRFGAQKRQRILQMPLCSRVCEVVLAEFVIHWEIAANDCDRRPILLSHLCGSPADLTYFDRSKAEAFSQKDSACLCILEKPIGHTTEDQTPFVKEVNTVSEVQEIVQITVADQDSDLMAAGQF